MKKRVFLWMSLFLFLFGSSAWAKSSKHTKKRRVMHQKKRRGRKRKAQLKLRVLKTPVEKLVQKMVDRAGGREAMLAIRAMYSEGKAELSTVLGTQKGLMKLYSLKPDRQRSEIRIAGQTIVQAFDGRRGWMKQGSAVLALPRAMVEMAQEENAHAELELRFRTEPIVLKALGERKIRGKLCVIVKFTDEKGRKTLYYISKKDVRLRKISFIGPSPLGQAKVRYSSYLGDYRWVKVPKSRFKVFLPFFVERYMGGRRVMSLHLSKILINPSFIKARLFRFPSPVD